MSPRKNALLLYSTPLYSVQQREIQWHELYQDGKLLLVVSSLHNCDANMFITNKLYQ
jgi:hypothetical protein